MYPTNRNLFSISFIFLSLENYGVRKLEALFAVLITTMACSFAWMFIETKPRGKDLIIGEYLLLLVFFLEIWRRRSQSKRCYLLSRKAEFSPFKKNLKRCYIAQYDLNPRGYLCVKCLYHMTNAVLLSA